MSKDSHRGKGRAWLREQVARYSLNGLNLAEVHGLANDLLDQGIANESVVQMFVLTHPLWYPYRHVLEVLPKFEDMLFELGVPRQSVAEATSCLVRDHVRRITE